MALLTTALLTTALLTLVTCGGLEEEGGFQHSLAREHEHPGVHPAHRVRVRVRVSGQGSVVRGQWSVVRGQWSVVSGQGSGVRGRE